MSGIRENPNDIAIVSFPGASQEFLSQISRVMQNAVGDNGGVVIMTAEEIKVADLTKLKAQLEDLLGLINQINAARQQGEQ